MIDIIGFLTYPRVLADDPHKQGGGSAEWRIGSRLSTVPRVVYVHHTPGCVCVRAPKTRLGGGKVQGTRALWTQFYPVFCCWILVTTNNRIRNLKPTRSKIHRTHTYTSYCTMTVAKYSTVVKQHHVARPSVRPFRPQGRNLNFTVNTA